MTIKINSGSNNILHNKLEPKPKPNKQTSSTIKKQGTESISLISSLSSTPGRSKVSDNKASLSLKVLSASPTSSSVQNISPAPTQPLNHIVESKQDSQPIKDNQTNQSLNRSTQSNALDHTTHTENLKDLVKHDHNQINPRVDQLVENLSAETTEVQLDIHSLNTIKGEHPFLDESVSYSDSEQTDSFDSFFESEVVDNTSLGAHSDNYDREQEDSIDSFFKPVVVDDTSLGEHSDNYDNVTDYFEEGIQGGRIDKDKQDDLLPHTIIATASGKEFELLNTLTQEDKDQFGDIITKLIPLENSENSKIVINNTENGKMRLATHDNKLFIVYKIKDLNTAGDYIQSKQLLGDGKALSELDFAIAPGKNGRDKAYFFREIPGTKSNIDKPLNDNNSNIRNNQNSNDSTIPDEKPTIIKGGNESEAHPFKDSKGLVGARIDKNEQTTPLSHTIIESSSGEHFELLNTLNEDDIALFDSQIEKLKPQLSGVEFEIFERTVKKSIKIIIGQGSFGKVRLATNNGKLYAVKKVEDLNAVADDMKGYKLAPDSELLATNIDYAIAPNKEGNLTGYFFQELISGVELSKVLEDPDAASINDDTRLSWATDAAGAYAALHKEGKFILDGKPENFMVDYSEDKKGELKMVDLGTITDQEHPQNFTYSPAYLPPEGFESARHMDQFSLGVTLWSIAGHQHPIESMGLIDAAKQLPKRGKNQVLAKSDHFNQMCNDAEKNEPTIENIALQLMHPDTEKRMEVTDALRLLQSIQKDSKAS